VLVVVFPNFNYLLEIGFLRQNGQTKFFQRFVSRKKSRFKNGVASFVLGPGDLIFFVVSHCAAPLLTNGG
jgi:hypothetical protein